MNQNNDQIIRRLTTGLEGILHGFNTARRVTALGLGLGMSAFLAIAPAALGDDDQSSKYANANAKAESESESESESKSNSESRFSTPAVLTQKMSDGGGSINLLKDVNAADLQAYLQKNGGAYLGVNLNEESRGKESGGSVGAAIKSVELVLTTTTGTVSFKDFYTGCTAELQESGAKSTDKFQALLGKASNGSDSEKSKESGSSSFDDVLQIRNVQFTGTLLGAKLNVSFLKTESRDGESEGNESFFNYSGGDKEFALLNESTAKEVKKQTASTVAAPSSVKFQLDAPSAPSGPSAPVPGAPAPPLVVLAMLGGVLAWKARRRE